MTVRRRSGSRLVRAIAAVLGLALTASGSGLPMCLSMLAQSRGPCDMHARHGTHGAAQLVQAEAMPPLGACHAGDQGAGCSTAGSCPSAGAAAIAHAEWALATRLPTRAALQPPAGAFASFRAPPLSPPPQA